jgi:flavoprotein
VNICEEKNPYEIICEGKERKIHVRRENREEIYERQRMI